MLFTQTEFEALAESMHLRTGRSASSEALRRILVDGVSKKDAAAGCLIQVGHIDTLLDSARRALERSKILHEVEIPATL